MFYSDYLLKFPPNNEKLVNYAEAYITCPMASNFLTTMNTMRDHFNNKPDTYVSIEKVTRKTATSKTTSATHQCQKCMKNSNEKGDAKSPLVPLDSACSAPGDGAHRWLPLTSTSIIETIFSIEEFQDRIRRINHVVVVMSPWNNMGFLKRTAVLYEIYLAKKYACNFDIALSWYDKKRLIDFFRRGGKGGKREIEKALEGIDIEKGECNLKPMKESILDAVKDDPADANMKIKDVLIEHLTDLTGKLINCNCNSYFMFQF